MDPHILCMWTHLRRASRKVLLLLRRLPPLDFRTRHLVNTYCSLPTYDGTALPQDGILIHGSLATCQLGLSGWNHPYKERRAPP
eukprot:SAG31_NODE_4017_length_3662_cov_2.917485_2_plen_84_part_00